MKSINQAERKYGLGWEDSITQNVDNGKPIYTFDVILIGISIFLNILDKMILTFEYKRISHKGSQKG